MRVRTTRRCPEKTYLYRRDVFARRAARTGVSFCFIRSFFSVLRLSTQRNATTFSRAVVVNRRRKNDIRRGHRLCAFFRVPGSIDTKFDGK